MRQRPTQTNTSRGLPELEPHVGLMPSALAGTAELQPHPWERRGRGKEPCKSQWEP